MKDELDELNSKDLENAIKNLQRCLEISLGAIIFINETLEKFNVYKKDEECGEQS